MTHIAVRYILPIYEPLPSLTPTGRVILGMIALGKQTGYDIKQFVDKSTRHFWAASYGQIYPELRRLEEQGLVRGRSEPTGGRARTVYELTDAGEAALADWLEPGDEPRSRSATRGCSSCSSPTSAARAADREPAGDARAHQRTLAQLRALEPHASQGPEGAVADARARHRAARSAIVDWCEATERRLVTEGEQRC